MDRIPEPELMLGEEQAAAYAAADLSELQQAMVEHFAARFSVAPAGRLLDVGCGSGDMTIRFLRAFPGWRALGVDGSPAMLERGREAVRRAGLQSAIALEQRRVPDDRLPVSAFDAVIANSVLHHMADPRALWTVMVRCARPGAAVMVMDLYRPAGLEQAHELVQRHGAEAPPLLQQDFLNSLCAAYTVAEVRQQLDELGLFDFHVEPAGDLHMLAWGVAPMEMERP